MPSNELKQNSLTVSSYGYSAVGMEALGATEYTLVTVVVDESGSTRGFRGDMEACLAEVIGACRKSPRADNLMLRMVAFDDTVREIQGFKPLMDCDEKSCQGCMKGGGSTALIDAAINAIEAEADYGRELVKKEYAANGIAVILTDGMDNMSTNTVAKLAEVIKKATSNRGMETLITILVGVNDAQYATDLQQVMTDAGMTQYVGLGDASAQRLAKLAKFVSKSVASQSQAIGTGVAANTGAKLLEI
jgi:uncharacterized protein YegL